MIMFAKEIYYNTKFDLPLTRKEFGELIDMSTENVIRILSEFRKDGLIQIDGSHIEIQNFESLEKISKFGLSQCISSCQAHCNIVLRIQGKVNL